MRLRTTGWTIAIAFLLTTASMCSRAIPDPGGFITPSFVNLSVTDISDRSVTLQASLDRPSGIVYAGFELSRPGGEETITLQAQLDGNIITSLASTLSPQTDYSVRAFADNGSAETIWSRDYRFTTLEAVTDNPGNPDNPGSGFVDIADDNFRTWILWNFDTDKDGALSLTEAGHIYKIELNTDNIASLDGIRHFTNLNYLHAEGTWQGSEDNPKGNLRAVDLSSNRQLTHITLVGNHISSLNLGPLPYLGHLDLDYNELTAIDLKQYEKLQLLQVSHNRLGSLDLRGLDLLDEVHCDDNPLTDLRPGGAILRYLDCHGTSISSLDLRTSPKINIVDCRQCPNLKNIYLLKGQVIGSLTSDSSINLIYDE